MIIAWMSIHFPKQKIISPLVILKLFFFIGFVWIHDETLRLLKRVFPLPNYRFKGTGGFRMVESLCQQCQGICLSITEFRYQLLSLLSSPELKAQVSFSDQNFSVVRFRCCHRCHCCCCCKFLSFSSSQEPRSQFQPNLAQSILGWRWDNWR